MEIMRIRWRRLHRKDRFANKIFKAPVATIFGVLKRNRDMRIEVEGVPTYDANEKD